MRRLLILLIRSQERAADGTGRYVTFRLAEMAVPREPFRKILRLIHRLRPAPLRNAQR